MVALKGEVEHPCMVERVLHPCAGSLFNQESNYFGMPVHGCQVERSLAIRGFGFDRCALFAKRFYRGKITFARRVKQIVVDISREQRQRKPQNQAHQAIHTALPSASVYSTLVTNG